MDANARETEKNSVESAILVDSALFFREKEGNSLIMEPSAA